MEDIHTLLKSIRERKGFSLREAAKRSGLSHSYIDSLEKGVHPKTKSPIKPSPHSLKALSVAYQYEYEKLMEVADYIEKDEEYPVERSELDRIIKEAESKYNVNLRDDPDVNEAVRELIHSLAKMKKK